MSDASEWNKAIDAVMNLAGDKMRKLAEEANAISNPGPKDFNRIMDAVEVINSFGGEIEGLKK